MCVSTLIRLFTVLLWLLILPSAAQAAPVVTFIVGIVSAISAFAASSWLAGAIVRIGIGLGLSALSRALLPQQSRPGGLQTSVTLSGATTPQSFILGRYATSGSLVCPPMTHGVSNEYLTYVIALGSLKGQTLKRFAVNGKWQDLATTSHADYGSDVTDTNAGHLWIRFYDGSQIAADPMLLAKYAAHPDTPWSSDMVGTSICYAVLTVKANTTLWSGLPTFRFELGGIPLYDPRLDDTAGGIGLMRWGDPTTWTSSEIPSVMIYNIMRGISLPSGETWGGDVAAEDLPYANWAVAMEDCDEQVPDGSGGTKAQYVAGFEVRVNEPPKAILEELLKSCAGEMADIGGIWKIHVGAPSLPTLFLNDDDILVSETRQLLPFPGLEQTHNGISTTHPDPELLWEASEAAPLSDPVAVAADGGRNLIANLGLPSVWDGEQVARLQAAWLKDDRRWRRHSLSLPPRWVAAEPFDVISWDSLRNDYLATQFAVLSVTDNPMTLNQRLVLREVNPNDWSL